MNRLIKTVIVLVSIVAVTHANVTVSVNESDFTLIAEPLAYYRNPTGGVGTTDNLDSLSGNLSLEVAAGVGNPAASTHVNYDHPWTVLPGNVYTLFGDENFNVLFGSTQSAFAFTYEDDSVASAFTLNFYNDAALVGSASFTTSEFNTEQFIGFISDSAFNKVTVREDDGASNSNEYFQFYTIIPEPATIGLLGFISGCGYFARRFFIV